MTSRVKLRMSFAEWSQFVETGEILAKRIAAKALGALIDAHMVAAEEELALFAGDVAFFGTGVVMMTPTGLKRVAPENVFFGQGRTDGETSQ